MSEFFKWSMSTLMVYVVFSAVGFFIHFAHDHKSRLDTENPKLKRNPPNMYPLLGWVQLISCFSGSYIIYVNALKLGGFFVIANLVVSALIGGRVSDYFLKEGLDHHSFFVASLGYILLSLGLLLKG